MNARKHCNIKNLPKDSVLLIVTGIEFYLGPHSYQHLTIFTVILLQGVIQISLFYKIQPLFKDSTDTNILTMMTD
ncbi:hypothetical protein KSF78_0008860 [Schistosoma japonicum]|nr:hypothetical protein KSF78_0008860 [Schistosoma japonicum]